MISILNTIGPLVVMVCLGVALRRYRFLPESFYESANRLIYWIGLPCLLFSKLVASTVNPGRALALVGVLCLSTVIGTGVAYGCGGLLLRLSRPSLGAFVQGAWRGNLAYIGVPVIVYTMESRGAAAGGQTQALAMLAMGALTAFYNVLAVLVLIGGQEDRRESVAHALRRALIKTITNPLILACVAGLAFRALSLAQLPLLMARSFDAISGMVLPLTLLGVGAQLSWSRVGLVFKPALGAALLKTVAMPLIGYGVGRLCGLPVEAMRVVLVFCACPTAIMSYVMAEQMKNDAELAAGIVAVSVVISCFTMSVALHFLP